MAILAQPRYENAADLQRRLNKTVIRYKNIPVYCQYNPQGQEDIMCVHLTDIHRDVVYDTVNSSDEELNPGSMRLGYMNKSGKAVFCARLPQRRNVQGISMDCLTWLAPTGASANNMVGRDETTTKPFFKMLNNDYPTLEKVVDALYDDRNNTLDGMAFCRNMCCYRDEIGLVKLAILTNTVAVHNPKDSKFYLSDRMVHYYPLLRSLSIPTERP